MSFSKAPANLHSKLFPGYISPSTRIPLEPDFRLIFHIHFGIGGFQFVCYFMNLNKFIGLSNPFFWVLSIKEGKMKGRSTYTYLEDEQITMHKAPSLVDLCVQTAVINVRYIGNVGETEFHLLERILPHCTIDQLTHVEDSTEGRDLSPVTNKLWKNFYERQFGAESVDVVVERMKQKKVTFKWRQLYKAKLQDLEEREKRLIDRMKQRYENEAAKKQTRQVQLCTKVPPSSSKRSYFGVAGPYNSISNSKSSIMKKAKLEFLNSREVKNLASVKNKAVQRTYSVSSVRKPGGVSSVASSSKPAQRRS